MSQWCLAITVGSKPEALINSLILFNEKHGAPQLVLLFPSKKTRQIAEKIKKIAELLFTDASVEIVEISESNIVKAAETIQEAITEAKKRSLSIAVDVTPGRKTMSLAAYKAAQQADADLTLYLHLTCSEYQGEVFPNIPKHCIKYLEIGGQHEA